MKKSNLMPSLVLGSICIVVALLLSVVNMITAPIIAAKQNAAANAALLEVLPGGKNFTEIQINEKYPTAVTKGWSADGGYVFQMEVAGYKPGLIIMCGVDADGKVVGVKHIATNETYGMENELNGAYIGDDYNTLELVLASGATPTSKTSAAYYSAVKAALEAVIVAKGGSVDTRDPAKILKDTCNAALGTENKDFTKWFATEYLEGIKYVYVSDDGVVMKIGDKFIGVDKDGNAVNTAYEDETVEAVAEEDKATVEAAYLVYAATNLTEITTLPTGISADVTKAYVTDSGNYVFEVLGKGYKYESNYEFVGIEEGQMEIKISISADGKIIDVETMKHYESDGFGDACATEEYYDQYKGHTNDEIVITVPIPDFHDDQIPVDCTDIGVISSSTFTTTGYQTAVKAAFAAFELLTEGGNQ